MTGGIGGSGGWKHPLVIIPAFNEARAIGAVVAGVSAALPGVPIAVIDDGSHDGTAAVARAAGAQVLRLPFNLGYGVALQTGYKWALRHGHDCVVQLDGDGQHEPADTPRLLDVVARGDADVALGSRFMEGAPYRAGWGRRLGMRLFRTLAFLLTGTRYTDVTSGFQALGRDTLELFVTERYPGDYPDADVLVMVERAGLRVREVPVRMHARSAGRSMHAGLRPLYYVFRMLVALGLAPLRRP